MSNSRLHVKIYLKTKHSYNSKIKHVLNRLVRILWRVMWLLRFLKTFLTFPISPIQLTERMTKKLETTANSGTKQIIFPEQGRVRFYNTSIKLKPGNQRIMAPGQRRRTTQRFVWLFFCFISSSQSKLQPTQLLSHKMVFNPHSSFSLAFFKPASTQTSDSRAVTSQSQKIRWLENGSDFRDKWHGT